VSSGFRDSPPFPRAAARSLADGQLRVNLRRATTTIREKRNRLVSEMADFEQLRAAAAAIKDNALGHLDELLEKLEANVTAAGGHVHFALDAAEANRIVVGLVKRTGAREVVKVKSMTTAEIRLNEALSAAGVDATETDLAELIVQLGDDLPSHIVVPAIHRNRAEIRSIFLEHMGEHGLPAPSGLSDEPAALAAAARAHLRSRFLRARVAISGANFAIAESGSLVVVESEGNGRMCLTLPETLISVVGIEKVIPSFSDLEVFFQLLARSATGERMSPYTSIWRGVTPGDGPSEFHLVLLDNGRSAALADRVGRQALRCIRCAACLNVCPVYERVGGHAYGSVYPGPIGAVITPQLHGVATDPVAAALPFASTLCGACFEVCPVRIDIPRLLVHLRARAVEQKLAKGPSLEGLSMAAAGVVLSSPRRLARAERVAGRFAGAFFRGGRIRRLPGPLGRWTVARDAPLPACQSFREWWRTEHVPSLPNGEVVGEAARSGVPAAGAGSGRRGAGLGLLHLLSVASPTSLGARRRRHRPRVGTRVGGAHSAARLPGVPPSGRAAVLMAVRGALRAAPMEHVPVTRAYQGVGETAVAAPLELFVERLASYRAEVTRAEPDTVAGAIAEVLARHASRSVLVPADLPESWMPGGQDLVVERDTRSLTALELDEFDSAVTGCAVAAADTGTIVLDGGPRQGRRALSLVPDHLVIVVLAEQVVPGVPDAIAKLSPRTVQTWISGPSATVDIELTRVEGVHGPRRLDVVLVGGDRASVWAPDSEASGK
jgi:L-lactate dehydrogenase complex protein LldF